MEQMVSFIAETLVLSAEMWLVSTIVVAWKIPHDHGGTLLRWRQWYCIDSTGQVGRHRLRLWGCCEGGPVCVQLSDCNVMSLITENAPWCGGPLPSLAAGLAAVSDPLFCLAKNWISGSSKWGVAGVCVVVGVTNWGEGGMRAMMT